jgi:hypothetical protein
VVGNGTSRAGRGARSVGAMGALVSVLVAGTACVGHEPSTDLGSGSAATPRDGISVVLGEFNGCLVANDAEWDGGSSQLKLAVAAPESWRVMDGAVDADGVTHQFGDRIVLRGELVGFGDLTDDQRGRLSTECMASSGELLVLVPS